MQLVEQQYVAHPTEYKGVEYRSKCEAIFAKTLDELGVTFWYEPKIEWLKVGDWVPDFLWFFNGNPIVIELKPGLVSGSYRRLLSSRFAKIHDTRHSAILQLVCANPYRSDLKSAVLEWREDGWIYDEAAGSRWQARMASNTNYRFDLVHY